MIKKDRKCALRKTTVMTTLSSQKEEYSSKIIHRDNKATRKLLLNNLPCTVYNLQKLLYPQGKSSDPLKKR